jgi:CubicO group peptidase (beta-lactamase class C family)
VIAYRKDEKIIDLCGGVHDKGYPYRNALQIVFSSTKAICGIVVAMMEDRGYLSYNDLVSKHWPEFAQGGKENVTILDLLHHAGGLAWLDKSIEVEKYKDLDYIAKIYAEQEHNFKSVRTVMYHTLSYGFMLNELVRRTDPKKRTIGKIVREEINEVFGTEIYIGLTDDEIVKIWPRVTRFIEAPIYKFLLKKVLNGDFDFQQKINLTLFGITGDVVKKIEDQWNNVDFFKVEIGAGNGITNAESLARLASVMAQKGQFKGKRLLSEEATKRALFLNPPEFDKLLNFPVTRTNAGFAKFVVPPNNATGYGWAGYGGSVFVWSPESEIGYGYVMNAAKPELVGGKGFKLFAEIINNSKKNGKEIKR